MDPSNLPSSTPIPTPLTPSSISSPASAVTSPYHSNASSPSVSAAKTHTINVPECIKQIQQKIGVSKNTAENSCNYRPTTDK